MRMNKAERQALLRLALLALEEDLGPKRAMSKDLTSMQTIDESKRATAKIVLREDAVVCGTYAVKTVMRLIDPSVRIRLLCEDGARLSKGKPIASMSGSVRSMVAAERTMLNFLQRLSGIATLTSDYVKLAGRYGVDVYDTRKTTPGWRLLEKCAVRCGGGKNHRQGLTDQVLIKSTHIAASGGLEEALGRIKDISNAEVEVRNMNELETAIRHRPGIIMLDNMTSERAKRAVALIRKRKGIKIEISGGISLRNLQSYCRLKPDRIAVGSITNSPRATDIHIEHEF